MAAAGEVEPAVSAAEAHVRGLLRWLREEEFIGGVAEWSWDWCLEFPRDQADASTIEHSLRFTEAHREYREIFEARAQEYLQHHGLASEEFLRLAAEAVEAGGSSEDLLDGLVASESYETFFEYMRTVRRRREWAEQTMCGASDVIDWSELVRRSLRRDLGDVTVGDEPESEFLA